VDLTCEVCATLQPFEEVVADEAGEPLQAPATLSGITSRGPCLRTREFLCRRCAETSLVARNDDPEAVAGLGALLL
jgi:hypothetical protein